MAGKLSEELEKNTEQQKQLYREQYYQNHGEYPPDETGCLFGLLKLIYIITIFPIVWCCKWIFKGLIWCGKWFFKGFIYMFKGAFYIFPKFLWRKGTAGKIGCGTYIFAWAVVLFITGMGKDYVVRNGLYLIIILVSIIATFSITMTFRLLDKQFTKRSIIALSSGIFVIVTTVIIGIFLTKHLIPLEGEVKSNKEIVNVETIQTESLEE